MKKVLTIWWVLIHLSLNKLFKIPVTGCLEFINFLKFCKRVSINKFCKAHVTASNSDDQFVVKNLCINSSSSKQVETVAKSSNWHTYLHGVDIFSQQLIDYISSDGSVSINCFLLCSISICQLWGLFTKSFFKSFNNDIFVSQNILESFEFVLLLLENQS